MLHQRGAFAREPAFLSLSYFGLDATPPPSLLIIPRLSKSNIDIENRKSNTAATPPTDPDTTTQLTVLIHPRPLLVYLVISNNGTSMLCLPVGGEILNLMQTPSSIFRLRGRQLVMLVNVAGDITPPSANQL